MSTHAPSIFTRGVGDAFSQDYREFRKNASPQKGNRGGIPAESEQRTGNGATKLRALNAQHIQRELKAAALLLRRECLMISPPKILVSAWLPSEEKRIPPIPALSFSSAAAAAA
ncbi:Hypothetical predicted protein [Cloeon dipterum]|uniref:Uncharacterized protein n=1 Tax=Cloeon dipterum TaxID=197152 RepID=A0A8S1CEB8_9INSE|nr:Hypothetical predicted protein [Cloeon dipterum]